MDKLKQLEQTGMLRIIYYLKKIEKNGVRPSEIQRNVKLSNDSYYTSRNKLIDMQITQKIDDKYSSMSKYGLTKKGKKIAEYIEKIRDLL